MRAKVAVEIGVAAALSAVAACGFGIDVDMLFSSEGPADAGGDAGGDAEVNIPSVRTVELAAGDGFTCGRRVDGTVMCWGRNDNGELGNNDELASSAPVLVKDVADATDLATGANHACVVRTSGTVACWGLNDEHQLGNASAGSSRIPTSVAAIDAVQIAAGGAFTCVVKADNTIACWGSNTAGQLGDGTVTGRPQPAAVSGVSDAVEVVAARATACALTRSGDVYCWGDNQYGAAGVDAPVRVLTPSKVEGLSGVKALSGGGTSDHLCARLEDGAVRCWGSGAMGALGNGKTDAKSAAPSAVLSLDDVTSVGVGASFTCAARRSGAVACWGSNDWRELGVGDDGGADRTTSPVPVAALSDATAVAAGASHACALLGEGDRVACWGANVDGALGRGTRVLSAVPVKVAGPAMVAIAPGTQRACGVDVQGRVLCWGVNTSLQLGADEQLTTGTGTPTPIPGLEGGSRVSGGNFKGCAVLTGGLVQCWGNNSSGALGNGKKSDASLPVTFAAGGPATDVGCGYGYCCALLGSGQVLCAGNADKVGRAGGATSTPVFVTDPAGGDDAGAPPPLSNVTRLAAGQGHACAIGDGRLSCWGTSSSGARAGGTGPTPNIVPLEGVPLDVTGDGDHGCAVLEGGAVRCWGKNTFGQTTGTTSGAAVKTIDLAGKAAKAIASGSDHTCAIVDDGAVRCWGRGREGQLGNGVRADALTPVEVKDLTDVKVIAGYEAETCALQHDGTAWCWGSNSYGQLGDGTTVVTGIPGAVVGY